MKWIAIAGTWRNLTPEITHDIQTVIDDIAKAGNNIVTCGAPGVDSAALQAMRSHDSDTTHIRVMLPSSLPTYLSYYDQAAQEGEISFEAASALRLELESLKQLRPEVLIEGTSATLTKEVFFENTAHMLAIADELVAFWVNKSEGTQDAIEKACVQGIPVRIFSYTL